MNKLFNSILFSLLILFSTSLYSQIDKEKKTLSEILIIIQDKYNYEFTYADDVIKNIILEPPSSDLNFNEVITYLTKETGLFFQTLDNNFVAIISRRTESNICGYIIDSESGEPLEGAFIIGRNNHTISEPVGYFNLKIDNDYENIIIRRLGFESKSMSSLSFAQNECLNIFLNPKIETLAEVVLTNYITKGIDKIADGSLNINFYNFDILPGLIETDVLQTIQSLPGIQSVNETVSDINIRGGTHDQNLILWDGIKMYQSGHFFGLISIFNPLITTNVALIKNGTDADLTDGVSGTIKMKTDANLNKEFKGSVGANFINVDGFIDTPIGENSSLQISARKGVRDIVETPTYKNYFRRILQDNEFENNENTDIKFDFYDTSARWLYKISEKDELRLNFLYVNTLFDAIEESKVSSLKQQSIAGGLFYRRNWSESFVTSLQIYETDYVLEADNNNFLQQQRLKQENKVSETSIKLNSWYKYSDQLSFLNGYQITESGVTNSTEVNDPIFIDKVTKVIREHALYSQLNFSSNSKNTHVKAGIRYSYIEKFNKHLIEPRLSINQKILDHLTIEALGEFKHQNTSQIVNIDVETDEFFGIEKRRWFLSNNNDLPIIKSIQGSVGLNYSNKGWLLSAEAYYKDVDGITSLSQGFLNQYIFKKAVGSYRVKGIDFLANKRFKKLNTWLSYSFGDNQYTFKDLQESEFPNNLAITHAITIGTSFSTENFKISAGFNYHTGKPATRPVIGDEIRIDPDNKLTINYQNANSSNLEDYVRVDLSAIYNFKLSNKINAQSGISIWNTLDHNNIINNYYELDNNQAKEVKNKALTVTPNIAFRVNF